MHSLASLLLSPPNKTLLKRLNFHDPVTPRYQTHKLITRVRFTSPAPLFPRPVALFSPYRMPLGAVFEAAS